MTALKKEGGNCHDFKQYGIYRDSPRKDMESGSLNQKPIAQGDVSSVVSVSLELEAGGEETFYYWTTAGKDFDEAKELHREAEDGITDFFEETEACWRGYLGRLTCDVDSMDDHVEEQLKRSILVIRSQTNDNGAITAANDSTNLEFNQDKYGYLWPRDGALVAETMAQAGYAELVKPFFDFMEEVIEDEGYLLHKYNPDKSLGSSWHPWVDESGNRQLPIQEDGTALVVWALKRYYDATGEKEMLEDKWGSLVKPAADFMADYWNESLSLPKPSYDLWEEKRYISSFTVAAVYAGLEAAAEIAEEIGEDGSRYRARTKEIREKGLANLRSDELKRYGRGIEDGELITEVSAPLIFLERFGLVEKGEEYFENTVNAIMYDLSPDTDIGGIARYRGDHYHSVTDDFDRVPGNPWIICTLWVAQHLIQEAETQEDLEKAQKWMHWTCDNSLETGLLPEQVDPFTGEPKSVAPLTWSHSTFIETSVMFDQKREELQS